MNNEKFIPNKSNIKTFDVKFLITYEEQIDWEKLSAIKERSFSIPEIKLFGKRIAWSIYMFNHDMAEEELMTAAKYFKTKNFEAISLFSIVTDAFIRKYADRLVWLSVLNNSKISDDTIFELSQYWQDLDQEMVMAAIINNPNIDLSSKKYERIALYLKLKK